MLGYEIICFSVLFYVMVNLYCLIFCAFGFTIHRNKDSPHGTTKIKDSENFNKAKMAGEPLERPRANLMTLLPMFLG